MRRIKERRTLIILLETFLEMLAIFKNTFVKELENIAVVIQVIIPLVIVAHGGDVVQMLITSCILTVSIKYIKEVSYKLNNTTDNGIPVPKERCTERDRYGFISFVEGKETEALLYLNELEEYFKKTGKLKKSIDKQKKV